MSTPNFHLPQSREQTVAHAITAEMLPDLSVSDRTQRTYEIGAETILHILAGGDWKLPHPERDSQLIGEFVGRAILNARRQGITLDLKAAKRRSD